MGQIEEILREGPVPFQWDITPAQIEALAQELVERITQLNDWIVTLRGSGRRFVEAQAEIEKRSKPLQDAGELISFLKQCAVGREVRDVAAQCSTTIMNHFISEEVREDVYETYKEFAEQAKSEQLTELQARHLELIMRDFQRSGMNLPQDVRDELVKLKQESQQLKELLDKSYAEDICTIEFTEEELAGCSELFINSLPKSEDGAKRKVRLIDGNMLNVLDNAKHEETRRRTHAAHAENSQANAPRFPAWLKLQFEIRKLQGYECPSDFMTEKLMSQNSAAVEAFLKEMERAVIPNAQEDIRKVLAMQAKDYEERGLDFDGELQIYNWRYYRRLMQEQSSMDLEKVREYFPAAPVVQQMLEIFSRLLHLRFEQVPTEEAHVWQEQTEEYRCYDAESSELLGTLFLDLFPREGKYSHAACWESQGAHCVERRSFAQPALRHRGAGQLSRRDRWSALVAAH